MKQRICNRCFLTMTLIYMILFQSGIGIKENRFEYKLNVPVQTMILPDTLREISGLTNIDSATFACVQDENGILFIFDVTKNKLIKQYAFTIDGDYEGIARVEDSIYVLRSDGILYEILDYKSPHCKTKTYNTEIPALNNEGLCYDRVQNRLLIGCKSRVRHEGFDKYERLIYAFDLHTKKLNPKPVIILNVSEIKNFALRKKISLPSRINKRGERTDQVLKLKTSAICVHPLTQKLYLLSACDYMLFVFDKSGKIEHIEKLDPEIFNKSEGISFFENGDMLISNEAQGKQATVLRFEYNHTK